MSAICYGPPLAWKQMEILGERWCFYCRARRGFEFGILAPTEPSYWGPVPDIRCLECGSSNSDLGFGRVREWDC